MQPILAFNLKTYQTDAKEIEKTLRAITTAQEGSKALAVVCPPVPMTGLSAKLVPRRKTIALGAQDVWAGEAGAYTGTSSASLLQNLGVQYVIVGHSERRAMGETDAEVNAKIRATLAAGMTPIVCVGELVRDEQHAYLFTFREQVMATFSGLTEQEIERCVIAYEPVWAIGKQAKRSATPEEAEEMSLYIAKILHEGFGLHAYQSLRVLYGGSVRGDNAEAFLKSPHIAGLLIGRASTDATEVRALFALVGGGTQPRKARSTRARTRTSSAKASSPKKRILKKQTPKKASKKVARKKPRTTKKR